MVKERKVDELTYALKQKKPLKTIKDINRLSKKNNHSIMQSADSINDYYQYVIEEERERAVNEESMALGEILNNDKLRNEYMKAVLYLD